MNVRASVIAGTILAILVTVTAVLVLLVIGWKQPTSSSDRLAWVGVLLSGGAFFLVAIGTSVALAAYWAATGVPRLEAELDFRFSPTNQPVFALDAPGDPSTTWRRLADFTQLSGTVRIHNRSRYSARNPALRIDLVGLGGLQEQTGWTAIVHTSQVGTSSIQWDGGADYAIHAGWTRELPPLDFSNVSAIRQGELGLVLILVADGFQSKQPLPVRVLENDDYSAYTTERAKRSLAGAPDR